MLYDRPVKVLLREFAGSKTATDVFTRADIRAWFKANYPNVRLQTVDRQTTAVTTNIDSRRFWNPRPGEDDLFFRLRPNAGELRLYDKALDPTPIYAGDDIASIPEPDEQEQDTAGDVAAQQFALEHHLRDFLAKNVALIEVGMKLFSEIDGIDGVEVPMGGGRSADILALDAFGNLVVVELKVRRGHERTVGQLLRYMGFAKREYAHGRGVRGIIIAADITSDLRLAAEPLRDAAIDVKLMQYSLKFEVKPAAGVAEH